MKQITLKSKLNENEDLPVWKAYYLARDQYRKTRQRDSELEFIIAQSPKWACRYALGVIKGRWPRAEFAIAKDPMWAFYYARNIIKGRWSRAESVIAQSPKWACEYALGVIKGRWREAEAVIAQDPLSAYLYAGGVIGKRWPEAEAVIAQSPKWAYWYAREIIRKRWPEAEPYIKQDSEMWELYKQRFNMKSELNESDNMIKARTPKPVEMARRAFWRAGDKYKETGQRDPELEKIIANPRNRGSKWAYLYAAHLIRGRWPEAESVIAQNPQWAYLYALNVIKGRWPDGEEIIAQHPEWAYWYAKKVIGKRWPEAEPYIAQSPGPWSRYKRRFKMGSELNESDNMIIMMKRLAGIQR